LADFFKEMKSEDFLRKKHNPFSGRQMCVRNMERRIPKSSENRFPTVILIFTFFYMAIIGLSALRSGNRDLVSYLLVMSTLVSAISIVQVRSHLSRPLLWCFSIWGLMHMAGGLVRIPAFWPYNSPHDVLYSLWLIPHKLKYDQIIHAYGFGITTWLCWQILGNGFQASQGRKPVPSFGLISLCIAGGMGFGALNETVEFIMMIMMPGTNIGGYENTGWDLIFNMIGSLFAGFLICLGRGTAPDRPMPAK
jgi:hypothetical protein